MFNYLDMVNRSASLTHGLEARAMQRVKTFSITKTDFFVGPKITDPVIIYSFDQNEESALTTFRDISTKTSKLKVVRLRGYYIKQRYNETVAAKRIIKNMRPVYAEINKKKKEYNITTVAMKTKTFKTMSYMVNLGYLLDDIKIKTFDKGILMSTKIRETILQSIKNNIAEASLEGHEKVLYFKGPFLTNTKIALNIVDSQLLKMWNPLVLLLEWFFKDEEGFKKWLADNHINIVLDNGAGQYLVLSRSEIFQSLPMYNFKYCIRLIHRLDGANLKEMGLTQEEVDQIERDIVQATDESEPINEEELNEMELIPDPVVEETDLEEDMTGFLEAEEVIVDKFSEVDQETKAKTANEIEKIFDEVPEEERASQLLELHNYRSLSDYIETDNVKELRTKMIKNYGKDVKEVVNNIANHQIEVAQFNNTVDNDYNRSSFIKLDKSYQDKLYNTDLENILIAPANLSFPLFLQDYTLEDISDREYRGDLLKATYLTHDGETLEFEMEIPKVVNNSIFMGGSEKYLTNQDLALPIIKTDEEVIITMAYNKTILAIKGKYANANDKTLVKTVQNFASKNDAIKVKTTEELSDFIYANRMSYRMIHMNKHFGGIRYKENGLDIDFDFRGVEVVKSGLTTCGHINDQTIVHAPWKDKFWVGTEKTAYDTESFIKHVLGLIDPELLKESEVTKLDNLNFVNSIYCTIMARDIPIILVMLIETPLKDLLNRLKKETGLEYSVVSNDKLEVSKLKNTTEYGYIILEDYTIRIKYNNTINQLILIPLINMDLRKYSIFDIAHIMKDMVGSDNLSIYLENFATSFIDPGSKRVLDMLNIPSDFTGLFIYAAGLFYDYKTSYSSDASNYRLVTPSEVITRIFYEKVTKELTGNVARTKRGSRQMITLPRDTVNKTLMTTMTNISEDSNISPFRSIMLKSSKSQKGHMGINMSRAFNMKRRMFNQNNLGTETFATAYSGQAGIIKYLPFNPKFADLTGRYLNQDTPEGLDPSNMSTFVDAFVPYLMYDDSPRRIMTNGQYNHVLPVKDADPMLVSYGADEAALYMCPEFSYIAEDDGEIVSLNEKFITVKYKDPKIGVVSYRLDNIERNSAKGYYLKNDFITADDMKVGKKIKKGTPIAYNKDFFKKKPNGAIGLAAGPLVNILICDGEGTWEDACVVSENLSNRLATQLIKRIPVKFNMSTTDILHVNLDIGGQVTPHTPLIKFNDLTEDSALNEFFTDVEGVNTKEIEAHYKGTLNDITVFYRTSRDTVVTKSIKQFLRDIEVVQNKVNHMEDLDNNQDKFNVSVKSSKPQLLTRGKFSKINGDVIENGEILIEFNIQIEDKVGPSDKLVVDRALKGEPSFVIPDEDRPVGAISGRVADILIDNQSVNARKTPGLPLHSQLLATILHCAVKNRYILNRPPEKGSLLDYKSSYDMVEGKLKFKD